MPAMEPSTASKADIASMSSRPPLCASRRHWRFPKSYRNLTVAMPAKISNFGQGTLDPLLALHIYRFQGGGSSLPSSNDRTSLHTRYITRRPTISPPINPAQSIIYPCSSQNHTAMWHIALPAQEPSTASMPDYPATSVHCKSAPTITGPL